VIVGKGDDRRIIAFGVVCQFAALFIVSLSKDSGNWRVRRWAALEYPRYGEVKCVLPEPDGNPKLDLDRKLTDRSDPYPVVSSRNHFVESSGSVALEDRQALPGDINLVFYLGEVFFRVASGHVTQLADLQGVP
jgi:hypothetical protein